MAETVTARRWIYSLLTGDTTLQGLMVGIDNRVVANKAPQGAIFPLIIFGLQTAQPDIVTVPQVRIAARLRMQVKVVGESNDSSIEPIYNQVDDLLQGGAGAGGTGTVYACVRDSPLEYLETTPQGVTYLHLGGLYRVISQNSP